MPMHDPISPSASAAAMPERANPKPVYSVGANAAALRGTGIVYVYAGTTTPRAAETTEPAGATLTWASDQSRSLGKSLKITKSVTSDVAMWQSENMIDYWSPTLLPNVDVLLGAYIRLWE